ncbi:hypothetical protein [Streptomyces boninensis]|uniref:hypothetical protein n=1 Tax=Streptomyces boninensis TaxID=2039455 RepID=UPI003B21938B
MATGKRILSAALLTSAGIAMAGLSAGSAQACAPEPKDAAATARQDPAPAQPAPAAQPAGSPVVGNFLQNFLNHHEVNINVLNQ